MIPGRDRFGGDTFELYEDEEESVGDKEEKVSEEAKINQKTGKSTEKNINNQQSKG